MRRLAAFAAVLTVPALPMLGTPAQAAETNVICVNRSADEATCAARPASLPAALALAADDGVDSVVRLGPGTYADGPYTLDGSTSPLTLQGSANGTGASSTTLEGGAGAVYVTANNAIVRNLRITVRGEGATGLALSGADAAALNVIVADTAEAAATGATGIRAQGGRVRSSSVNLDRGEGNTGIVSTDASISRATTRTSGTGVVAAGGSLAIDNSVLNLGTSGEAGLRAGTEASTGAVAVDARHLTVVGGAPGSRGVWAFADGDADSSTVTVANSIVRGSAHALAASASGGAASVTATYSDVELATAQETGAGTVTAGDTNLDLDPAFLAPARDNFRLRAGSPVIDQGSPLVTTGDDRDDNPRAVDGDRNGSAVPDMGAFELSDTTAPRTTFASGPQALSNDNTPVFVFGSEDGARFECQVDGGQWQTCGSPATTPALPDGAHTFSVRATDEVGNVEAPAAAFSFTVDTTAPETTITKKPAKRVTQRRVRFQVASNDPGATFQRNLDGRGWTTTLARFTVRVKLGRHVLQVRAVDAVGNIDPTPVRYRFTRVRRAG